MSPQHLLVTLVLCALLPQVALAEEDALDQVTGTESWSAAAPTNVEAEWREWYRARVSWRRMLRQARVQLVVNRRLALLLKRAAGGPNYEQVLRVIRAGARQIQGGPASPQRPPGELAASEADPGLEQDAQLSEDADEQPGSWSEVPVERLDDSGQALDGEGDRELKKLMKER